MRSVLVVLERQFFLHKLGNYETYTRIIISKHTSKRFNNFLLLLYDSLRQFLQSGSCIIILTCIFLQRTYDPIINYLKLHGICPIKVHYIMFIYTSRQNELIIGEPSHEPSSIVTYDTYCFAGIFHCSSFSSVITYA